MDRIPEGTKVWSVYRHEYGVVEAYNKAGNPCVRWEYGDLTATLLYNLRVVTPGVGARIGELGEKAWG